MSSNHNMLIWLENCCMLYSQQCVHTGEKKITPQLWLITAAGHQLCIEHIKTQKINIFCMFSWDSPGRFLQVYQAPCQLHSVKAFHPLQRSFHFSDHNIQSTDFLSCCVPNFDLFVHHSIWCVPSHPTLICLPVAPFINLSGHCACQSRAAITLHLSQWETPASCLTNPLTGCTGLGLRPSITPQLSVSLITPQLFFSEIQLCLHVPISFNWDQSSVRLKQ